MTHAGERAAHLIAWVTEQGLLGTSRQEMLAGVCEKLCELGVPLWRFHLAQRAFHPKFGGIGFNWTRAAGLSSEQYEHRETPRQEWVRSPFYDMLQRNALEFRSDLTGAALERFPLLQDLKDSGATEYFATGLRFGEDRGQTFDPVNVSEGVLVSWTTNQAGGFAPEDLQLLRAVLPHLGLALKSAANRQMATDLLQVYLGRDAGRRVLSGEIQRGSSRQIDAVICLFDLNGFTTLAEQLPGPELISMVNDYFGIAVAAIQAKGGNILKFLGDGILAMFDLGSIDQDARAALDAATALSAEIRRCNAERAEQGLPVADFTLALHAGEILYGNIGAENRLDFTVIGPTVNLTARISGMHRSVGQPIIMSEHVQRAAQGSHHDLVSLGRYMLRGVSAPIELFTIHTGPGQAEAAGA
ncbi:adenylate/guanylate cyclase domain-containing protein [Roseobacteraceae bacterium NS-SX3]